MIQFKSGRAALLAACAATVLSGAARAADFVFLTPAEVDAAIQALPPAPADGSPQAQAELAELKQIEATRTSADLVAATSDDRTKNVSIFAAAVGPGFDPAVLPATTKLFADIRADEKAAADQAKDVFKRNRPWIVDPRILSCFQEDGPQSSYPSGHSTMGYTMAAVLSQLVPEKADAIEADYGHNRMVCEMHFRSDVEAGHAFGGMLAKDMAQSPAFQAEFTAARQELRTAHLTAR